eukprot:scaffold3455_cov213-Prasinococcus_capsulatus_cf.AAC.10
MSAFQEVLQRLTEFEEKHEGEKSIENSAWNHPTWLSHMQPFDPDHPHECLTRTLRAAIQATECGAQYSQASHFATAASFATMNHLRSQDNAEAERFPYPVDYLLRTESLSQDLGRILSEVPEVFSQKKRTTEDLPDVPNVELQTSPYQFKTHCAMVKANTGHDFPHELWLKRYRFNRTELRHYVENNEELLKAICGIYVADFICFGYELPTACSFPGYSFV